MKPNFIVIGAAKCATTGLCGLLAKHPDVFICTPKEPHFFALDRLYNRGMGWYEELFKDAQGKTAIGEGSTSFTRNLRYPHTAQRLHEALPDAKLIYIVRHPLQRMESSWMHCLSVGIPVPANFGDAVRELPRLVDVSQYWKQISVYRNLYPDDRILVLFYEDYKADRQAVLEKCFRFLNVDPTVQIEARKTSSNASVGHLNRRWLGNLTRLPFCHNLSFRHIPKPVLKALDALFAKPITARPQWDQDARRFAIEQITEDAQTFLEFYGKPKDFWPLEAEES